MFHRWFLSSAFRLTFASCVGVHGCSARSDPPTEANAKDRGFDFGMGGLPGTGNTPGAGLAPSAAAGGWLGGNGGASGARRDECARIVQEPETIFIDASVTDTIVTYSPIALFVMIDRSSSMVGLAGDAFSWLNAQGAIAAFVQDPASTGIDMGLGAFPPMSNQAGDCAGGTDCGTPIVPIASLPRNSTAITNGLLVATPPSSFPPLLTPTECGLRGMVNRCVEFSAQASEQCVAILITDGAPTLCDLNGQNLISIVADGKAKGVLTFALALPGSNQVFLDQLAVAGGTSASIPVIGGLSGQQQFLAALTAIRSKVSRQESRRVSTSVIAPLPCQWTIPPPRDSTPIDRNKVNLELTVPGLPPQQFTNVADEAACAGSSNSWHYDDHIAPKQVALCPSTCAAVKAAAGATVSVVFGCETRRVQ